MTGLNELAHLFFSDPFKLADSLWFNPLRNDKANRGAAKWFTVFALVGWIVTGWDGAEAQLDVSIQTAVKMLMNQATWADVVNAWYGEYGSWLHWSSLVTYALVFYYASKHLSSIDVKGTFNTVISVCVTFLSIGIFEVYWMLAYAHFQNQPWVITWIMPQARILIQNTMFLIVGIFGFVYMWGMGFKWEPNNKITILLNLSVILATVWVFYPFNVPSLTVGNWTNTNFFPQTLYTVLNDPHPAINAGEAYWVQGDLIHFFNITVKALMAWLVLEVARGWRRGS